MADDLNKLIIVGNGFDLYHGLKTKYVDFLKWFYREDISDIKKFVKETLVFGNPQKSTNRLTYIVDHNIIGDNKENAYEELDCYFEDRILKYFVSINCNNSLIEKFVKGNWSSFERIYFNLLREKINDGSDISSLNYDLNEIQSEFKIYLKNESFDNSIYFKDEVYKFIIEKPMLDEVKIKKRVTQNFENNYEEKICVLNFNYTNTVKKYVGDLRVPIVHIHGNIDDEGDLIFGYGDEMDEFVKIIENKYINKLMAHFKSLKYLQSDRYFKLLNFLEKGKFCVYVIGHSCDITDRVLLNEIFEHPECQFIKTAYYEKYNYSDFNDRVSNIYRCFKDKNLFRKRLLGKPFSTKLS